MATRHQEAQKFFDQGLVLLYGFNRHEALRSFQKVLELDPHAAMASGESQWRWVRTSTWTWTRTFTWNKRAKQRTAV